MSTKWMGKGEWGVCASQRCHQSQKSKSFSLWVELCERKQPQLN